MGCTQSANENGTPNNSIVAIGRTERIHRPSAIKKKTKPVPQSVSPTQTKLVTEEPPKLDERGKLLPEEVSKRRCSSGGTMVTMIGKERKIRVEYAYVTQRGYYPTDPHKHNQDSHSIVNKFNGLSGDSFFAVYDGHGPHGEKCANFAKKELPRNIAKYVQQERYKLNKIANQPATKGPKHQYKPEFWPMLSAEQYERACKKAHIECNRLMIEKEICSKLSGTTAISVAFHDMRMTVCNVGDSRALLGISDYQECVETMNGVQLDQSSEEKSEIQSSEDVSQTDSRVECFNEIHKKRIVPIPLSTDQTPWRQDERERLKKKGARIMTIGQMEGREEIHENFGNIILGEDIDIEGDPPRVWLPHRDSPGTAFSRSLGDAVANSIGVNAEPEIFSKEITDDDKILVLASDGVFEFLDNQTVIDICGDSNNPHEACIKLVDTSYEKWLCYEDRTDDITAIVLFLSPIV